MAEERLPDENRQKDSWRNAQATACQFLAENGPEIAETMRAKAKFLETLVRRLSHPRTSFDDRLDSLARISEVARLIGEDADGFFELASQPVVARILATVPGK